MIQAILFSDEEPIDRLPESVKRAIFHTHSNDLQTAPNHRQPSSTIDHVAASNGELKIGSDIQLLFKFSLSKQKNIPVSSY